MKEVMNELKQEIAEQFRIVKARFEELEKKCSHEGYADSVGPKQFDMAMEEIDILHLYIKLLERRYVDALRHTKDNTKEKTEKKADKPKIEIYTSEGTIDTEAVVNTIKDVLESFIKESK